MSEDRTYPTRPFIGVGTVVWKKEMVLLIKRGKEPAFGEWSLPGGTQEIGETVEATAAREVFEETGCQIKDLQHLRVIDEIHRDENEEVRFHYTLIDCDALWSGGNPLPGQDELDARFFDLTDIPSLEIWDETVNAIHTSAKRRGIAF